MYHLGDLTFGHGQAQLIPTVEHYARNKDVVAIRWPKLAEKIDRAPLSHGVLRTDTRESTLQIDGVHLASGYDRRAEAKLQATLIPTDAKEAWLYGTGLGDLAREILSRPGLAKLHVVILSTAIVRQSMSHFDHTDWLSDSRVELELGADQSSIHPPFAISPACLQLAAPDCERLRDLLMLELAAPFQRRHFSQMKSLYAARLIENRDVARTDRDVAELFGSREGATMVVAAAGPTLEDQFEFLRTQATGLPIISVNRALAPLLRANLLPSFTVVIDPLEPVVDHFRAADLSKVRDTPLVYTPGVHPEVLSMWPGPRFCAHTAEAYLIELAQKQPRGKLHAIGTVTHAAVDLAVKMGANTVILLGADFCYIEGQTHTAGASLARSVANESTRIAVTNGRGERVSSDLNLCGYLRDLEDYVEAHPQVRFLKADRRGSRLRGVKWLDEVSLA